MKGAIFVALHGNFMIDYSGNTCLVCEKKFVEEDDIVVCPICGTPYHRDCYQKVGECVNKELHESGESWQPDFDSTKAQPDPRSAYELKDKECSSCGILNYHSSENCVSCGTPLNEGSVKQKTNTNNNPYNNTNNQGAYPPPPFGFGVNPFDPLGGVNATEMIEDGISYGEMSKLVERNTMYYMPVFKRLKEQKKNKFNIFAFLFTGAWLLYRKQYKSGIVLTIAMFAMYLGQTFTTLYLLLPTLNDLYLQAGIDPNSAGSFQSTFSAMQFADSTQMVLMSIPGFLSIAMFVIMIIMGNIGNKIYMKSCIGTIKKTKRNTKSVEEYDRVIAQKSGVNTSIAYCILVCYFLCTYLPLLL